MKRPTSATEGPNAIDMGHASIHLKYEDRAAHADVEFASAHGGELRVDVAARVNLAYPAVTEGIDAKKIPVHGKVVAKDFDVAWLARFNEQVETLGGKVSADAKMAGTVGDPQFIGDVRWKNGKVVAIDPAQGRRAEALATARSAGRRCRPLARVADGLEDRIEVEVEVAHRLVARQAGRGKPLLLLEFAQRLAGRRIELPVGLLAVEEPLLLEGAAESSARRRPAGCRERCWRSAGRSRPPARVRAWSGGPPPEVEASRACGRSRSRGPGRRPA